VRKRALLPQLQVVTQASAWFFVAITTLLALCGATRADDVNIAASTNSGVNLNAFTGTTARVFPGITVSNTGTLMPGGTFSGVAATTQAWTLTNQGTIATTLGNAITFNAGGTVNNNSLINSSFNGIRIQNGGSITNTAGAVVEANASSVWVSGGGALVNSGHLIGRGSATAVSFDGGGTITNNAGARIEGNGAGNGLSLRGGTTRILTNDGTITDVAGGFAAGVAMQGGTLTNSSSGVITGSYNAVWATTGQPISIINAGRLTASTAGAGAIELQHGGSIQNSGTIEGGFGIEVLPGSGVTDASTAVTNSGTITGTNGTAIRFRTGTNSLTLQTGSVLNGNVIGGPNADSLVLMGAGTEGINKFSNFETLSMQGTAWALTGTGTFSTSSTIQSGVLAVNGQLTSPTLTIQNAGTLGGAGTLVGTVNNSGTIAPGNSIGTLSVTGNVVFAPGSIYEVEANAAGQADKILATGVTTIQGGTVRVLAGFGNYAPATTYTILTANGGRSGAFTGATSNFAFLTPVLGYDPTNVYLTLNRNSIDFGSIGDTRNQRAAGGGVEALGWGDPIYGAVVQLDAPSARKAFDALSGEVHASVKGVLIEDSRFVREAAINRLRASLNCTSSDPAMGYGPAAGNPFAIADCFAVWGQGFGSWGQTDSDGNAASLSRATGGVLVGTDASVLDTWRIGLLAGYSRAGFNIEDRQSSGTSDNYPVGLYGGTQWDNVALRFGLAHTWHDIETNRSAAFPGFVDSLAANYHAATTQAFGELGYSIKVTDTSFGDLDFEPFANFAYVNLHTNGFGEKGGAAALAAQGSDSGLTFTTLGLRASSDFTLGGISATAKGTLGWRHALGDITPLASLAFAGGGPFTVAGVPIAREVALVETGLDFSIAPAATLGIFYNGQFASDAVDQSVRADVDIRF
jgi:outer membrane autotransporter protein